MDKFGGLSFSLTNTDFKVLLLYKNSDEIRKNINSLSFFLHFLLIVNIFSLLISILNISFFGLAQIIFDCIRLCISRIKS